MSETRPLIQEESRCEAHSPGILVVDDEPAVAVMLDMMLQTRGWTVWRASSGEEALEIYRRVGPSIALVLMDVLMPNMDGPQTLRALRGLNPDVVCCLMSGITGGYSFDELFACGAACFLPKPFRLAELEDLLQEMLGASSSRSAEPSDHGNRCVRVSPTRRGLP